MASLPEHGDFETEQGETIYRQWENGIITAAQCREKLRGIGEFIAPDQFSAMEAEELDAATFSVPEDQDAPPDQYDGSTRPPQE